MTRLGALAAWLHERLEAIARKSAPRVEKVLGRLPSREEAEAVDFATDADLAILRQEPLRARMLLRTIGIVVALSIMWAAVAQLDEVTRGEGKVIPSRQVQILQSIDGGLVSEILVREGDVVQANQLLIKIDETRFVSSVKENRAQYLGLDSDEGEYGGVTGYLLEARARLEPYNAVVMRCDTQDLPLDPEIASVVFGYQLWHIDGAHDFKGALSDLILAHQMGAQWMLLDDYDFSPEVRRAGQVFAGMYRAHYTTDYKGDGGMRGNLLYTRKVVA